RPVAIKSRLRRRLGAQRVAERTWTRGRARCATSGGGEDELGTEGPLVDEPVAEHAHHARVVENTGPAAEARFPIAEHIIGESQTRSEAGPTGVQSVLWHSGVAGNAILPGEEDAWRRVGINSGNSADSHSGQIDLSPAVSRVTPRKRRLVA